MHEARNPNPPNMIGEGRFDIANGAQRRFTLRQECRSLLIETFPDGNGDLTGSVDIHIGDASGPPWRTVAMGNYRCSPMPSYEYITIAPSAGSKGIVAIVMTSENLGFSVGP